MQNRTICLKIDEINGHGWNLQIWGKKKKTHPSKFNQRKNMKKNRTNNSSELFQIVLSPTSAIMMRLRELAIEVSVWVSRNCIESSFNSIISIWGKREFDITLLVNCFFFFCGSRTSTSSQKEWYLQIWTHLPLHQLQHNQAFLVLLLKRLMPAKSWWNWFRNRVLVKNTIELLHMLDVSSFR